MQRFEYLRPIGSLFSVTFLSLLVQKTDLGGGWKAKSFLHLQLIKYNCMLSTVEAVLNRLGPHLPLSLQLMARDDNFCL